MGEILTPKISTFGRFSTFSPGAASTNLQVTRGNRGQHCFPLVGRQTPSCEAAAAFEPPILQVSHRKGGALRLKPMAAGARPVTPGPVAGPRASTACWGRGPLQRCTVSGGIRTDERHMRLRLNFNTSNVTWWDELLRLSLLVAAVAASGHCLFRSSATATGEGCSAVTAGLAKAKHETQ